MKRYYVYVMKNGIAIRQAIQPARTAQDAIHASGFLPPHLMPIYESQNDRAHFVTPSAGLVIVAQRA